MPQFVLTVQPDNKAEHLADYSSSLASLSRTVDFADVTFHFGHGAKIRTNKLLLARASKLFGQVFEVNCNACAPVNYDIICPDVSPDSVQMLLELLQSGCTKLKNEEKETGLNSLMQVVKMFQLDAISLDLKVIQTPVQNLLTDDLSDSVSSRTSATNPDDSEPAHQYPEPGGSTLPPADDPEPAADAQISSEGHEPGERLGQDDANRCSQTDGENSKDDSRNRKRKRTEDLSDPKRSRLEHDEYQGQASDDDQVPEACVDRSSDATITIVHHDIKRELASPETNPVPAVASLKVCHICDERYQTSLELAGHYRQSHRSKAPNRDEYHTGPSVWTNQDEELSPDLEGQQQQQAKVVTVKQEREEEDQQTPHTSQNEWSELDSQDDVSSSEDDWVEVKESVTSSTDSGLTERSDFNSPAKCDVTLLAKGHLRDLHEFKKRGLHLSSFNKKNEIKNGNTFLYECDDIEKLKNTDNGSWKKPAYSKVKACPKFGLGPGARRQWTAKGNPRLSKIVTHYAENNMGIVRYTIMK